MQDPCFFIVPLRMTLLLKLLFISIAITRLAVDIDFLAHPWFDFVDELVLCDSYEDFDELISQIEAITGNELAYLLKYNQVARCFAFLGFACGYFQNLLIVDVTVTSVRFINIL